VFEEGVSVLRFYERSRGFVRLVSLGKVTVIWLLATMEALRLAEGSKAFVKSSRVGSKAFIAKRCLNKFGLFLAVVEYGGGDQRAFLVILEGKGGRG
jgi:hypothetical protein